MSAEKRALVLTRKVLANNYWRYEFYVPETGIYLSVLAGSEEEARERAREILDYLLPSDVKGEEGAPQQSEREEAQKGS